MNKSKQIQPETYQETMSKNQELFYTLLKQVRPDLYVLADLLDSNKLNMFVVFKIMRQILNIASGSRWGRVIVNINDNKITHIEGVDSDKINEGVFSNT